jgi:hypothetical protein
LHAQHILSTRSFLCVFAFLPILSKVIRVLQAATCWQAKKQAQEISTMRGKPVGQDFLDYQQQQHPAIASMLSEKEPMPDDEVDFATGEGHFSSRGRGGTLLRWLVACVTSASSLKKERGHPSVRWPVACARFSVPPVLPLGGLNITINSVLTNSCRLIEDSNE